ncbi:MAG: hypothetical protein WBZ29_00745 [Methanocella sp.]
MPPETVETATAATAIVAVAIQYYVTRKAGTWFFVFGLLGSSAITLSAIALFPGAAWPEALAAADIGILVAGCAAFASSAWLYVAFKMAGDMDGG